MNSLSPKVKHFEKRGSKSDLSDTDVNDINDTSVSISTNTDSKLAEDQIIGRTYQERYLVTEFLAGNDFSQVYLVTDKIDPILNKKVLKLTKKVVDEIDTNLLDHLLSIENENIIKYYTHFSINDGLYIINEFCQKGDLSKQIALNEKFTDREIFKWISEACNGLKTLHSQGIIHRNIKPENILLSDDDVVKLVDIEIRTLTKPLVDSDLYDGSRPYMSPELYESLESYGKYSFNTDIWSLGCVLYEMMFLKKAFADGQRSTQYVVLDYGNSPFFSSILPKMLERDPQKRFDSNKLLYKLLKVKELIVEIMED